MCHSLAQSCPPGCYRFIFPENETKASECIHISGYRAEQRRRLAELAAADFTNGTNPRPATASDYERLLRQAM